MPEGTFAGGADKNAEKLKDLSSKARLKGLGNSEFGDMREILVVVSPSSIAREYAREYCESMLQAALLDTGNPNVTLPFSESDLFVYLTIMLRERVNDINKRRTMFSRNDQDVKIPDFFYLMMQQIGEVIDERRHVWLRVSFDHSDLDDVHDAWTSLHEEGITPQLRMERKARLELSYSVYTGESGERTFIYQMSKFLKMLERIGAVNGSALPRGLEGTYSFMLFMWAENRLLHVDPNVEPGLGVLASLLKLSRDVDILNPYIPYGPTESYRILMKEVTIPRGRVS